MHLQYPSSCGAAWGFGGHACTAAGSGLVGGCWSSLAKRDACFECWVRGSGVGGDVQQPSKQTRVQPKQPQRGTSTSAGAVPYSWSRLDGPAPPLYLRLPLACADGSCSSCAMLGCRHNCPIALACQMHTCLLTTCALAGPVDACEKAKHAVQNLLKIKVWGCVC